MEKSVKSQTFSKGIIVLFFSQIVIKLLGFIYRVVITGMDGFGDIGNSYYGAAFQFYTAILAISTVGIPSAVAKLVSEKVALKDYKGAHKIFRTALGLFITIGALGTALMYFGADIMAGWVENPGVAYSLKSLSFSIFFVAIASIIRGYFQGFCDMKPQANSQILDQLAKCFFTIWLTWFAGQHIVEFAGILGLTLTEDVRAQLMAAAATFGSTIGTIVSVTYLYVYYKRRQKDIKNNVRTAELLSNESKKRISFKLIALAGPIMLGSVITSIAGLVNLFTVMPRLLVAGKTPEEAKILYGMITGKSDTLLNLPLALNVVYATSLVPNISKAFALKDFKDAARKINFSLFSTVLITLPAAVGISVLSDPIIKMLFPTAPLGGFYIKVSAYAVIFIALAQTLSGALQGMGEVAVPAISLLVGATLKYILNYFLVAIDKINVFGFEIEMNVMGAAYSTIACYLVAFLISFVVLNKKIKLNLDYIKCFVKPAICSCVMGVVAYFAYRGFYLVSLNYTLRYIVGLARAAKYANLVTTLFAIGIAVVIYGLMVLLVHAFSDEELGKLPVVGKVFKKIYKISN